MRSIMRIEKKEKPLHIIWIIPTLNIVLMNGERCHADFRTDECRSRQLPELYAQTCLYLYGRSNNCVSIDYVERIL